MALSNKQLAAAGPHRRQTGDCGRSDLFSRGSWYGSQVPPLQEQVEEGSVSTSYLWARGRNRKHILFKQICAHRMQALYVLVVNMNDEVGASLIPLCNGVLQVPIK